MEQTTKSDFIFWCLMACILSFAFGVAFGSKKQAEKIEIQKQISYAKGMTWQVDHKDSIAKAVILDTDSAMIIKLFYKK